MGADFPEDIYALDELCSLSNDAKGYLAHHIRNSLTTIILGIECGKLTVALAAAEHIEEDLKKVLGERYAESA
jgi:hypothetical protein